MMIPPDSPDELSGFPEVAAVYGPYYKVHLADTEASYSGKQQPVPLRSPVAPTGRLRHLLHRSPGIYFAEPTDTSVYN
jgi:hypothetical protein